jgi:hypothetical protein
MHLCKEAQLGSGTSRSPSRCRSGRVRRRTARCGRPGRWRLRHPRQPWSATLSIRRGTPTACASSTSRIRGRRRRSQLRAARNREQPSQRGVLTNTTQVWDVVRRPSARARVRERHEFRSLDPSPDEVRESLPKMERQGGLGPPCRLQAQFVADNRNYKRGVSDLTAISLKHQTTLRKAGKRLLTFVWRVFPQRGDFSHRTCRARRIRCGNPHVVSLPIDAGASCRRETTFGGFCGPSAFRSLRLPRHR